MRIADVGWGRTSAVLLQKRWLGTESPPKLLRDYLQDCLYSENEGYFSKHANIGPNNEGNQTPLDFPSLLDEMDYRTKVAELYKKMHGDGRIQCWFENTCLHCNAMVFIFCALNISGQKGRGAWLTPVEIFRPWYGKAIAKHIINKHYSIGKGPLQIFEIGGGSGTCMVDVLNHIKEAEPKLLKTTKYTILEISERLASMQRQRAVTASLPSGCWEVLNLDSLAVDRILSTSSNTSVIALEVLDNLPHDKVIFDSAGKPWQCIVAPKNHQGVSEGWRTSRDLLNPILFLRESSTIESGLLTERFERASDDLILHCLDIVEKTGPKGLSDCKNAPDYQSWYRAFQHMIRCKFLRAENCPVQWTKTGVLTATSAVNAKMGSVYLPTMQLRMLEMLARCLPTHRIILADFDAVPGSVVPGANGPAVQVTTQGDIQELDNYLTPKPGSADIFFPTDFLALRCAYGRIVGRSTSVLSALDFFGGFDDVMKGTTTLSGYCPLTEDYVNTSFLVSDE